jgi:hypothetical protein
MLDEQSTGMKSIITFKESKKSVTFPQLFSNGAGKGIE